MCLTVSFLNICMSQKIGLLSAHCFAMYYGHLPEFSFLTAYSHSSNFIEDDIRVNTLYIFYIYFLTVFLDLHPRLKRNLTSDNISEAPSGVCGTRMAWSIVVVWILRLWLWSLQLKSNFVYKIVWACISSYPHRETDRKTDG